MDGEGFSARGGMWTFDRRWKTAGSGSPRGAWSAPWPSVKLRATRDQLSISSALFESFVVTPANVVSIMPFDWLPALSRGLRFEVSDHDEATVFWTYRRAKIMRELISLGWRVDRRPE